MFHRSRPPSMSSAVSGSTSRRLQLFLSWSTSRSGSQLFLVAGEVHHAVAPRCSCRGALIANASSDSTWCWTVCDRSAGEPDHPKTSASSISSPRRLPTTSVPFSLMRESRPSGRAMLQQQLVKCHECGHRQPAEHVSKYSSRLSATSSCPRKSP